MSAIKKTARQRLLERFRASPDRVIHIDEVDGSERQALRKMIRDGIVNERKSRHDVTYFSIKDRRSATITVSLAEAEIFADALKLLDEMAQGLRGRAKPHVRRLERRLRVQIDRVKSEVGAS